MMAIFEFFILFMWRMRRADFFSDFANAFERRVGIRDFLERELKNASMVEDSVGKFVCTRLLARLAAGGGDSFRTLFFGIAPKSDMILLSAIDDAKDKVAAFRSLAHAVSFKQKSLKVLAVNLAMPMIAIPIVGAICLLSSDIVKSIEKSAPPSVWTGFNSFVRFLATFINEYWVMIAIGLVAFVVTLVLMLPRWTGPLRSKVETWPVFDLYRKYNVAIVLGAISMIISNGKSLREAIDILRVGANPWLSWQLKNIVHSLEDNPNDYGAAFGKGLMPNAVRGRMLSLSDSMAFNDALIVLGSSESDKLSSQVEVAAVSLNWSIMGIFASIAIVLSLGQMTIAGAMANSNSPSAMRQTR